MKPELDKGFLKIKRDCKTFSGAEEQKTLTKKKKFDKLKK